MPAMMQQMPEVMRAPTRWLTCPAMMKNTTPTMPAREFMFITSPLATPRR